MPAAPFLQRLFANRFLADIAKLTVGTAGGRIILLAAMPIATRLYDPQDFTLLASYMALVGTLTVAACLRFEIAIPLVADDRDAGSLLALALLTATFLSASLLALALGAPLQVATAIGNPALAPFLWLVAVGVFFMATYAALQYWATRARRFDSVARTRVGQAGVGAATMLGLGWLGASPIGLLLGQTLAGSGGGVRLALEAMSRDQDKLRSVSIRSMRAAAVRFRRYPLFSTPEALANVASLQVPILIIAATAGEQAGQLFLAMQLMVAPLMLLGTSVGQAYMSRANEKVEDGTLRSFTLGMMTRLFVIGLGPMLLAAAVAPWVFPVVFGAEWQPAGAMVAWIAPWMLLQLTVSPVSTALYVTNNQALALALQLSGMALRIGSVLWAREAMPRIIVEIYALSGAVFYLVYVGCVVYAVRRK